MIPVVENIDGKFRRDGTYFHSKIPVTELNQILQTNLFPEVTVLLLNKTEKFYSDLRKLSHKQSVCLIWKVCEECKTTFLTTPARIRAAEKRGSAVKYCGQRCNGMERARYRNERNKRLNIGGRVWTEERKQKHRESMTGDQNWAWKGGVTYFRTHGNYSGVKYIRCPQEYLAMARKDGYVMEHRLLVAQELCRPLLRSEVVHHLDHDPTNNQIENLMLFASNRDHKLHEHGHPIKPLWQLSDQNTIAE